MNEIPTMTSVEVWPLCHDDDDDYYFLVYKAQPYIWSAFSRFVLGGHRVMVLTFFAKFARAY